MALRRSGAAVRIPQDDESESDDEENGTEVLSFGARMSKGLGLGKAPENTGGSPKGKANKAKDKRNWALMERKMLLEQLEKARHSNIGEGHGEEERAPSAGDFAYEMNRKAVVAANVGNFTAVGLGTTNLSPITRMDAAKLEAKEREDAARRAEEAPQIVDCANNLASWYDAGLTRDRTGSLQAKKPLPQDYDYAPWSSARVPQVLHQATGVVIWPTRFDVVPLFEHFEMVDHSKSTALQSVAHSTTVFHYCSKVSFNRIVAPPKELDPSEVLEPHAVAEEIWDRIGEDLQARQAEPIEGASEYSLPLVALEPCRFEHRDAVACAAFRTKDARHQHAAVAYCVPVLVPTDKLLAVGDSDAAATVLVLAPGEEGPDDDIDGYDTKGKDKKGINRLVKWSMRTSLLVKSEGEKTTTEKVRHMALLEGLIDADTIRDGDAKESSKREEDKAAELSTQKARKAANADEEEERLEDLLQQYEDERELIERKIRHAVRAQERNQNGDEVRFLLTDENLEKSLRKKLLKCEASIERVKQELRDLRADLEITIEDGTGAGPDEQTGAPGGEEKKKIRRRRKKVDAITAMQEDVTNFVSEVAEEYNKLAGSVFREVFGGHRQGVEDFLEAKGDPNALDFASGWMPLHMAVANGDLEITSLLIKYQALANVRSKDHGLGPMHLAVRKSNCKMLELLLAKHARAVREKCNKGNTPLMTSMIESPVAVRHKMVSMMLEAHADANADNNAGWNPLSYAVRWNMRTACKVFVLHGGKVLNDMPETGPPKITIWQAAARHKELQDLLKEKLNSRDLQALERRFPGTIKRGKAAAAIFDED